MSDPGQRTFHLVMALLLMISLAVDQQELSNWRSGQVSMISLGLAMAWLSRYVIDKLNHRESQAKITSNRLADLEHRVDQLERENNARRGPF